MRAQAARMSRARLLLTLAALLAFTVQNYLAQTHIHFSSAPLQAAISDVAPAGPSLAGETKHPSDQYPAKQDPANCPLCQKIAQAGHDAVPAAVLLFLLTLATLGLCIVAERAPHFRAPSHIWQGRAPPSR